MFTSIQNRTQPTQKQAYPKWCQTIVLMLGILLLSSVVSTVFAEPLNESYRSGLHYYRFQVYDQAQPFFKKAYIEIENLEERQNLVDHHYQAVMARIKQENIRQLVTLPEALSLLQESSQTRFIEDLSVMDDIQRYRLAAHVFFNDNLDILDAMLDNDLAAVQAIALYIIGEEGYEMLIPKVEPMIKAENPMVRTLAAQTLSYFNYTRFQLDQMGYEPITEENLAMTRRDATLYVTLMEDGDPFFIRLIDYHTLNYIVKYVNHHVEAYNRQHPWQISTLFSDSYFANEGVEAFSAGLLNRDVDVVKRICEILVEYFKAEQSQPKMFSKSLVQMYLHASYNRYSLEDDQIYPELGLFRTNLVLWVDEETPIPGPEDYLTEDTLDYGL